MKFWILVMAAVALLVWSLVREPFEATASIRAPPYDDDAKLRIFEVANTAHQTILLNKAAQGAPSPPNYATMTSAQLKKAATDRSLASTGNDAAIRSRLQEDDTKKLKIAAGGIVAPTVGEFFTSVFKPATVPIKDSDVTTFMASRTSDIKAVEEQVLKTYFVGQQGIGTAMSGGDNSYAAALAALGQNVGYLVNSSGSASSSSGSASSSSSGAASGAASSSGAASGSTEGRPPPVCEVGLVQRAEDGKCVNPNRTTRPTCPAQYTFTSAKQCKKDGGTETTAPVCPAGYEFFAAAGICDTTPVDPTCPSTHEYRDGQCEPKAGGATGGTTGGTTGGATSGTTGGPTGGMAGASSSAGSSASTTGGSSTSTWGPTTGGSSGRLRQVFGPQFAGSGGDLSASTGDSSQTNVYPELLGGIMDTSSRIPGAGINPPSKNWTLTKNGSLPPQNTMGSDEMSRYFPFSRSPGDMDVIPDPYRVAQTFSSSSYSSKTEPVPFLTDFSAFQR